ncbi:MAG: 2,3-bisphosphoglycerate-independent phosphoglycerate mutase [Candidatus Aminicenantes bacterium]|nr:2,3-bisphosphoglycerate-independent phosphoglycerate mutase [Candidatus Aminicenantes bacterium]
MDFQLRSLPNPITRKGPVIVIIMDGIGIGKHDGGDAVFLANTPVLDSITKKYLNTKLMAHGTYVGLPSNDDMGNSEVGHNAIGAGRVYEQGAKLVNKAIKNGTLFEGDTWKKLIANCQKNNSALHFIGLLSDGNVHSHIDQLKALIAHAAAEGIKQVYLHALLDGRDVPPTSAPHYINEIETFLAGFNVGDRRYKIASGGGRMKITMDRYQADWGMVELGWKTHVEGNGRYFNSALEAVETLRQETGADDQFMAPFVIAENGKPVGKIKNGDSVILFNFRGDRAIEISKAFEDKNLKYKKENEEITFKRNFFPQVEYAGMMQYDGDLLIPKQFLVSPPFIERTMGEYLAKNNIFQFAISETQKFGHVTYFWNGNRSGKFSEEFEDYENIPSDAVPFEQKPRMKSAEIADKTIEWLRSGKYKHGRINFPNGDMVGHTGDIDATRIAVESVDLALGRILKAIEEIGGIALVTADHGNSDQMYEYDDNGNIQLDKVRTSHSLNPVPFIIYDPSFKGEYQLNLNLRKPGLSNIAATVFNLLGYYPPDDYDESLITMNC